MGWRKLDGSQRCQVHLGLTEQHAVRAKRSSKKRQTKPIEISHKPLALKELTSIHSDLLVQNEPNSGSLQDGRSEGYTTIGSRYADEPGRLWIGWPRLTRNGTERPGNCVGTGMVQKRVTAQGWLGSTPEGQRPQIRGLRAGGSLAVASSIPATQLSSPARLAERVVTPHAPMTLGANHVSRAPERG